MNLLSALAPFQKPGRAMALCPMRTWQPAAGSPSVTFGAQRDPQGCSSFLLALLTRQEKKKNNSQEKNKDTFGVH